MYSVLIDTGTFVWFLKGKYALRRNEDRRNSVIFMLIFDTIDEILKR
jgi:hypothetical protein